MSKVDEHSKIVPANDVSSNGSEVFLRSVTHSGLRETLLLATVIIIVPTLIFVFVSERFGFLLPRLNFDFLIVYAVSVFVARRSIRLGVAIAVVGTALVLFLQIAFGLGAIYIDDPALLKEYLGFVDKWPWRLISFWAIIGVASIAIFYFVVRRLDFRRARIWPVVALFVLLVSIDALSKFPQGYSIIGRNPVTSSTWRARNMVKNLLTKPRFSFSKSESTLMGNSIANDPTLPDKVLSIAVEAWGISLESADNAEILRPLRQHLGSHYMIEVETHRGHGSTITGELRELCNARTIGTPTAVDAQRIAPKCMPAVLKSRGFDSIALHGNSRIFYNRYQLYPALGFNRAIFYDDLVASGQKLNLCRKPAFEGVCDQDMLRLGLGHLERPGRRYAHLMTLDTHFPLAPDQDAGYQCKAYSRTSDPEVCLYVNQFSSLMDRLGREIAGRKIKPGRIYLFGDHRPPYALARLRSHFLQNDVPFITLTLRNANGSRS